MHKVYKVTHRQTGEYYIGKSKKLGKAWDKYYGSGYFKDAKQFPRDLLDKEILAEYTKASHASWKEFLLQQESLDDPLCKNSMLNIRLRKEWLIDFDDGGNVNDYSKE